MIVRPFELGGVGSRWLSIPSHAAGRPMCTPGRSSSRRARVSRVVMWPGPSRRTAEVVIATSAPTRSALATSSSGCRHRWLLRGWLARAGSGGGWRSSAAAGAAPTAMTARSRCDLERLDVEVGLVEAVEQDETVGSGLHRLDREVGHRRVDGNSLSATGTSTADFTSAMRARSSCSTCSSSPRRVGSAATQTR